MQSPLRDDIVRLATSGRLVLMADRLSAGPVPLHDLQGDSDTRLALRGIANARAALQAGVTTVRDLGSRGRIALDLRDAVAAGVVPGLRMLACGRPITSPGGHCHFLGGVAQGVEAVARPQPDARARDVRTARRRGPDRDRSSARELRVPAPHRRRSARPWNACRPASRPRRSMNRRSPSSTASSRSRPRARVRGRPRTRSTRTSSSTASSSSASGTAGSRRSWASCRDRCIGPGCSGRLRGDAWTRPGRSTRSGSWRCAHGIRTVRNSSCGRIWSVRARALSIECSR
jgi:hypothetical protein